MVSGEENSVLKDTINDWLCSKTTVHLQEHDTKDTFNVDKTRLFFKLLPDRTYTFNSDDCSKCGWQPLLGNGTSARQRCSLNVRLKIFL